MCTFCISCTFVLGT